MRIDSIAPSADRAGRYAVKFNSGQTMRLYRQTVQELGLYPGMELDEEQMTAVREHAGAVGAKMRAVRIVTASGVSKQDLEQRLIQKGEDPVHAREAVQWMDEMKLVDDSELASQIVARCAARGYGRARAKQMLYEKKIPAQYWEDALDEFPDQTEAILRFLRTKLAPDADDRQTRKVVDALLRRGHSYGQIRKGLELLDWETDEFWEDESWQR